jgi:hypothetical protein
MIADGSSGVGGSSRRGDLTALLRPLGRLQSPLLSRTSESECRGTRAAGRLPPLRRGRPRDSASRSQQALRACGMTVSRPVASRGCSKKHRPGSWRCGARIEKGPSALILSRWIAPPRHPRAPRTTANAVIRRVRPIRSDPSETRPPPPPYGIPIRRPCAARPAPVPSYGFPIGTESCRRSSTCSRARSP